MSGTALPTTQASRGERAGSGRSRLVRLAGRYSLSAAGPISVSGAHFAASIIFLHQLAPAEFGMFSFLLVVVPFALSISSGLFGAPLLSAVGKAEGMAEVTRRALGEANRFYCLAAGLGTAVLMYFSDVELMSSLLLGGYGATMAFRWFARSTAYNSDGALRAASSDFVYSAALLAGLMVLVATGEMSLERTTLVLLVSALVAVLPFGWSFLKSQLRAPMPGFASVYAPLWKDVTRWSLMGVVFSEMTANAHAYLVTFISGAHAFALLAIGSLMMRPLSLVLSALPDRERPAIARALASGDIKSALATVVEFRVATAAVWLGTVALSAAILIWFPNLVIRDGFDGRAVIEAVALWSLIAAMRAFKAPEQAFLIAAGEFHPLARAGIFGSIVSLAGVLVLLVAFGPVTSLFGIAAGEAAMSWRIMSLMASWRRAHG